MASLADRCSHNFNGGIRQRGTEYHRQRRVQIRKLVETGVSARVRGNGGRYDVDLDWGDRPGVVEASCDCPYFAGGDLCKHVWAALLALDERSTPPELAGSGRLNVVDRSSDDRHEDDGDDDEVDGGSDDEEVRLESLSHLRAMLERTSREGRTSEKKGTRAAPPNWKSQLTLLDRVERSRNTFGLQRDAATQPTEVWYVLDVGRSVERNGLVVAWMQRQRKKNGEWGKIKRLQPRYDGFDTTLPADDRELLQLLLMCEQGNRPGGYYSYHYGVMDSASGRVPPSAYDWLLPRLAATGRLAWSLAADVFNPAAPQLVRWHSGAPCSLRLRIATDGKTSPWRIEGELTTPEGATLPPQRILLLAGETAALFDDGTLQRVDARGGAGWIELLRRHDSLVVPRSDRRELLERLWGNVGPPIEWPDELQLEQVRVAPQGKLRIHRGKQAWSNDRLFAHLTFVYDGREIGDEPQPAALVDVDAGRVVLRDFDAEHSLVRRLTALGLRTNTWRHASEAEYYLKPQHLVNVVERLTVEGWQVEAEGYKFRQATASRLSVASGVDWFDLSGTFEFDGASVDLPTLLAAIRAGERFVRLGNDGRGLIPETWQKQYQALAATTDGAEGSAVRFPSGQALLLDALLAEQPDADVDRKFAACRERLRRIREVGPAEAPAGFVGALRDYQRAGLGWLHFLREVGLGGCLADDMGLGKTIQVLALLEDRRTRRRPKGEARAPSLVVAPKTLVFNWLEEARRFTPNLRVLNLTGLGREAHWESPAEHDVVLTTYGTLRRDVVRLKDVRFDYVILDEAQAVKTADSQAAKACRLLQSDHRLAMTGTPIENRLAELWSLFEFLNPGLLGRSASFGRLSDGDAEGRALIARCVAPLMLRRTKQQVLTELPEKTEQTLYCELPAKQRKLYDELRDYYRRTLLERVERSGLAKAKIHVLESLLRLRQAACHPALIDAKHAKEPSAKLDALDERLDEILAEKHKALVFSQFTSLLALVRKRLEARGVVYEYLDGKTRDRAARVERFQNDDSCGVFLISLKAGGCGLNLTAADYVFILDPWWNPAVEAQAIDRAYRIGQRRSVSAYRLIARDTVEEKILALQASKRELADAIVRADDGLLRRLTVSDLQDLLS